MWALGHTFAVLLLMFQTDTVVRKMEVTAGAVQGSVLGSDLWNVVYDGLLRLQMTADAYLVGYADDVAVVITAGTLELTQYELNQVMQRVKSWMGEH